MDNIFVDDIETDALSGVGDEMLNDAIKSAVFLNKDEWFEVKDFLGGTIEYCGWCQIWDEYCKIIGGCELWMKDLTKL